MNNIYKNKLYYKKNPDYHLEDSFFKYNNLIRILKKYKTKKEFDKFTNIVEIGCGAGKIVHLFKKSNLFKNASFYGYDINPDAIKLAKLNFKDVNYICDDFLENNNSSNLVICADVFEHIENPYNFLKKLSVKSDIFIFNIPIEINLLSILFRTNIFKKSYKDVGHLHFYTKDIAILLLENCGYKIINTKIVSNFKNLNKKNISLLRLFFYIPHMILSLISYEISSRILGGCSLIVLAKKK